MKAPSAKIRALLEPARWDALELLGVGRTAQVRAAGRYAVKIAHPGPEARARLREEVALHAALSRAGVPVARLYGARRDGRALVRERLGAPLGASAGAGARRAAFALVERAREVEARLDVRLDLSPSNFYLRGGEVVLGDAGARLAPRVFRAQTLAGFEREWRSWARRRGRPLLLDFTPPPSGRFHLEVKVGPAPGARLLWRNAGALARLGAGWDEEALLELGNQLTFARPTTTRVATRYVDMLALDRARGPRGDGRAVVLGVLDAPGGRVTVGVKGCGPTPLAWKGQRFHDDGFVSFPRTLWEVSVADELARLGFDTTEYVAVLSTGKTTVDNTLRRWPAAAGVRVARTFWRLGHLRRVAHRPDELRDLLAHVGRELLGDRWSPRGLALRFASALGSDIGRTDALQIHCFNPTPGNVRLDGHPIDFSTVRFFRHYVPDFRFLENRYPVRLHKVVWLRLVRMLVEVLEEGGALRPGLQDSARRSYLRAYREGFLAGLGSFFGLRGKPGARLVRHTQALRELRGPGRVRFRFWKQDCPEPLFDLTGRAPAFVAAVQRGAPEPWRALLLRRGSDVPPAAARLAERWTAEIRPFLGGPARRWDQVVRPFLEPEALARLLYLRSSPRRFTRWKELISSSRALPEGLHGHASAQAQARALGHVAVLTLAGERRRVVGLTSELLGAIRRVLHKTLGQHYVGAVVHGSRLGRFGRAKRRRAVRELGPVPGLSSDLDLKIFVRRGGLGRERQVGEALEGVGAWFPFSAHAPPWQRLLVTRHRDVAAAFRAWNGAPRRRELGKGPVPVDQAAVLDAAR